MTFFKEADWIWPTITDTISAKKASKQGFVACAFCAGATLLFVILSMFDINPYDFDIWSLSDVVLFIVIGWGIYKMNRFAAMAGLVLYIVERVFAWFEHSPKGYVMTIIFTVMFISSIRGVFAYHRYQKEPSLTTSTPARESIEFGPSKTCPTCGAKYNSMQYNPDAVNWICPQCHSQLPRA
jgi:hypothetical protein